MSTEKDIKLNAVQKANPELYEKVKSGSVSLTDAYNDVKRVQLGLDEFRGRNTKKKQFSTDFKRIIELHKPTAEELVSEIKKMFPITWKEFIK